LHSLSCPTGFWFFCAAPSATVMYSLSLHDALPISAVAVAVKVTGLPVSPVALAVSVLVPGVVPSVHDVTAAMPLPFVATLVGLTVPPPDVTAKATAIPDTGFPAPSRTITDGGVATAVPAGAD